MTNKTTKPDHWWKVPDPFSPVHSISSSTFVNFPLSFSLFLFICFQHCGYSLYSMAGGSFQWNDINWSVIICMIKFLNIWKLLPEAKERQVTFCQNTDIYWPLVSTTHAQIIVTVMVILVVSLQGNIRHALIKQLMILSVFIKSSY